MSKYEVKLDRQGPSLNVIIAGTIDEDIDFNQFSLNGAEKVSIKMEGVKSINSCGIREWIKWVQGAGKAEIVYEQCPKIIVDQINMVDGFLPQNAKVNSFFVPFYNDDSGQEKNVLFRAGVEFKDGQLQSLAPVKDDQGQVMEMDVIETKYFKFLKVKA